MAAKGIDLYDRQRRLAWYLIVPAVLVVLLVIGFPLGQVVVYSFMKYKLDGVTPASFVGLENYAFVLSDPDWWRAVWNTLFFTFFSVTLETILGLAVALVANAPFKGRTLFRIALLVPWAIPTVVSSQIWKWMFNDVYGVVNLLLTNFHHHPGEDRLARDSRDGPAGNNRRGCLEDDPLHGSADPRRIADDSGRYVRGGRY